jgi:hypothetical protein
MKVKINFSSLRQTQWHEYLSRFLIGGGITAFAGIIAQKFGPVVAGLFLAFPAIFPASATLIEKHERQKKELAGVNPGRRGRTAAALDAAGAAMGSIGMFVFALLVWRLLPQHQAWAVLSAGIVVWLLISVTIWRIFETL